MKLRSLLFIAAALALLLLPLSCSRTKLPTYAQKLPDPGTTAENHPVNRYNNALLFNKPICVSVSIQGAT